MNPFFRHLLLVIALAVTAGCGQQGGQSTAPSKEAAPAENGTSPNLLRATYSPLHFKPAIETAKDAQCLECHKEILEDRVRPQSPAGVKAADSLAWYQRTSTYNGDQDTFHRRHLVTPMARQFMKLQCNTCHQGHDPREEAPGAAADGAQQNETGFTLRKQVNPETTCLKCHGKLAGPEVMGLPGPWEEVKDLFHNDCLACHASTRTVRHRVSYLDATAIEAAAEAGKRDHSGGDVCFGCHGGRAWYRITYPYARNPWPEMPEGTPEWAKERPTRSESRFLNSPPKS